MENLVTSRASQSMVFWVDFALKHEDSLYQITIESKTLLLLQVFTSFQWSPSSMTWSSFLNLEPTGFVYWIRTFFMLPYVGLSLTSGLCETSKPTPDQSHVQVECLLHLISKTGADNVSKFYHDFPTSPKSSPTNCYQRIFQRSQGAQKRRN